MRCFNLPEVLINQRKAKQTYFGCSAISTEYVRTWSDGLGGYRRKRGLPEIKSGAVS